MSDLVGNPEDRFSHNEAYIFLPRLKKIQEKKKKLRAEAEALKEERKAAIGLEEQARNLIEDDYDEDLLFTGTN